MDSEEIVYDVSNIEEIEHFDIGEEGCSDPEEVTAQEVNIWDEDHQQNLPLSRQGRRGKQKKKPGRKRGASVIKIPRSQPHRAARVKSFQQFDTFDDNIEEEEDMEQEDCDVDLIVDPNEKSEESNSKTWRVFVRNDGSGMHFDWPIFMNSPATLSNIVSIISTNASLISPSLICNSIPQEYTNTGTFVVKLEENSQKDEICDDGLGAWHSAQMFVRKYVIGETTKKPMMTSKNDHSLKIVCEQFIHPGTDNRGDFIRKVYTGFDNTEHMIPFVVISYEWMGQPHPLTVYEGESKRFEQNTWKKCANSEVHVPILVKQGCDYNTAVSILLSTEKFTICGKSVPMFVQECISFVLDINECGGDRALYSDGNEWQRPSGSSKKFKVKFEDENDPTSWRIEKTALDCFDIQVICRRYVGKRFSSTYGFVRKIFLVKIRSSCPKNVAEQLVNTNLALVSYMWRDSQLSTFIKPENEMINQDATIGEEVIMFSSENVYEEELREIMKKIKMKKKENKMKLIELMNRSQRLMSISSINRLDEDLQSVNEVIEYLNAEI